MISDNETKPHCTKTKAVFEEEDQKEDDLKHMVDVNDLQIMSTKLKYLLFTIY